MLTDEQIEKIFEDHSHAEYTSYCNALQILDMGDAFDFARAIEQAVIRNFKMPKDEQIYNDAGQFEHEMCLYCVTINDDVDCICIKRNRVQCQMLPCPDFRHCDTTAIE